MEPCDLLVSAPWVLPVAPQNVALPHHAIAVSAGRIVALDDAALLAERFTPAETLHLDNHILLPGLVNAHGHAAMTLLRGAGEDQMLQAWLEETIWPLESRLMSPEFVALGTELAIAEMLASGTTTFSDMYFFPEVTAETASRLGMRAQVAFPVIEFPNAWSNNVAEGLHKGLELFHEHIHNPLVTIALGPHAAYTVSPQNLAKVAMYANEVDTPVQIHLHENEAEVAIAHEQAGKTWVQVLADAELLGPGLQAVHMTTVNDEDFALIADSGTQVVHCPTSNLKLASGYCDVQRFTAAGVNVGLGTDGAASNNCLDLFSELRVAALLAKHESGDPTAGKAADTLAMATIGGARALGQEAHIGSLEVGKFADFISVDARGLGMVPLHDPFAALVHGQAGSRVDNVFVAGERLLANRQLARLDVDELTARIDAWQIEEFHGRSTN